MVNNKNTAAQVALLEAIEAPDALAVSEWLKNNQLGGPPYLESNPLIVACRCGEAAVLEALLAAVQAMDAPPIWADVNHRHEDDEGELGTTLLAEALRQGHEDAARVLVRHGADVNASYWERGLSSDDQRWDGHDHSESGICWWLASDKLLVFLKDYGLEPDVTPYKTPTALVQALLEGRSDRVAFLLKCGADANQLCESEDGPIGKAPVLAHAATLYFEAVKDKSESRHEIVRLLLLYGASLGETFDWADGSSHATVVDLILGRTNTGLDDLFGLQNIRAERMVEGDSAMPENEAEDVDATHRFLTAVIDGSTDLLAPDLPDRLIAAHGRYQDSPDFMELFTQAANSYGDFMMHKAQEALARIR